LLRQRVLPDCGASSPQATAISEAGTNCLGLRARNGRNEIVLDVLLQRPVAAGVDTGRVSVAYG
jgi:hypothetical protein